MATDLPTPRGCLDFPSRRGGGAEGNRTPDLLIANQGQNLAVQGGYGKASVAADMLKDARLHCRHLVCFFTSCGIDSFGRSTPTAR